MAGKKKKDWIEVNIQLTSTQEVLYQRDFKLADRAGGFHEPFIRTKFFLFPPSR